MLLYLLVVLDVRTLAAAPRNAGVLSRLPEVQRKEFFGPFGAAREELRASYPAWVDRSQLLVRPR
ncbi:hypothetical protein [Nocardioides sp. NPDC006273]|uniref:hypothetical protein n=1 Tax=Nocardioides sp. NPDC006273 TaxID=3155598 RepID=UPI0033A4E272